MINWKYYTVAINDIFLTVVVNGKIWDFNDILFDCCSQWQNIGVRMWQLHNIGLLQDTGLCWSMTFYCITLNVVLNCLTLIIRGGGGQMVISLQPNVRLTSNQAVFLSLSVVLRSMKENLSIWTMEGPWWVFYRQGSPKSSIAGSILESIWGSMKVHEGSLNLGEVQQWP